MTVAKVSVGIPVYNGERWLRYSVQSIVHQSHTDLEIVICDNASADGTERICTRLAASDSRIRYFRNRTNIGVFRNYDLVFKRSTGRYFKWCAVGDGCDRTFLKRAVAVLDADPKIVLVHSRTRLTGVDQDRADRYLTDLHLASDDPVNRFQHYVDNVRLNNVMSGLIRSRDLARTCLNREFPGSDKCMIAQLALYGKFHQFDEELLYRRMQTDTATALKSSVELKRFYAHEREDLESMSEWRSHLTLLQGVLSSDLEWGRKWRLLRYLGRRMRWKRDVLWSELTRRNRGS